MLFGGLVAVFLGAEQAGAALVVDGLGLVGFEDLDGRGDLVSFGREDDAGDGSQGRRSGCGGFGVVVIGLRPGPGRRGRGGFEQGHLAEVGLGDLHAVHEGGGGGAVHESAGEVVDDAIEVDLDRGAVFGELQFEPRVYPPLELELESRRCGQSGASRH